MGHQYGNAKDIEALQTGLNTAESDINAIEEDLSAVDLDVLANFTAQTANVSFTTTGATAESCATAIDAIITNLIAAGLMADS